MNAIAMLERCAIHQRGAVCGITIEAVMLSSAQSREAADSAYYGPATDVGIEGAVALPPVPAEGWA